MAAHNEALFIMGKLNMFGRKKQFTSEEFWLAPGFGVALWWLWGGFGFPIGYLSDGFEVA
jgi:hypothetical protein